MGSSSSDPTGARWRTSSYSSDQGGECVECLPLGGAVWRTSSYSGDQGGDCVACAPLGGAVWRTSRHSSDQGGDCVEVAETPQLVAVRDSKVPAGDVLHFPAGVFAAFVRTL
ncbi:DUF397 domain-containing protein [Streptomyces spongiicola]|uniref:DUF397 domain-containing protein n=1 Tax=Streptomyces spongiicola TaxID=1690221 RepID=A0ABM6V3G4_9ACTN|nr:DUF397 domain-containing protein [Streptomyces spongiicola]AWK08337.1 DUF397 domain-containing protein [Streptomyces spongiicola]